MELSQYFKGFEFDSLMDLIQLLYIKKGQVLKLFCDDGFFKVFASQCKYYQNNIEWKLSTQYSPY